MNLDWRDKKHCFPKFEPQVSKYLAGERSIFEAIDEQDIILHHPYESFQPILDFIDQAAHDPDVVAIKQTLYRVSSDSSIINSLMEAAQQGKSVTVLFEVKARFNELSNIEWAEKLERVGGHVIYGTSGLKTHCKLSIVIKKNKKGNLKPYIHLGTGNYNEKTALVYTDFSFFTSNKKICEEAVDIFNMLTGFSEPDLKRLICAPVDLRNSLVKMIQNEIDNVEKFPDKQHFITIKVNSLIDKNIIEKLYEASSKGVQINLIVRGMCLINTSLSEAANIHVRSIVGRFLEHSRIYIFSNNGDEEIYLSSADVMERNLDKRFEICFQLRIRKLEKILSLL
jgi:polyphosphate kinase